VVNLIPRFPPVCILAPLFILALSLAAPYHKKTTFCTYIYFIDAYQDDDV